MCGADLEDFLPEDRCRKEVLLPPTMGISSKCHLFFFFLLNLATFLLVAVCRLRCSATCGLLAPDQDQISVPYIQGRFLTLDAESLENTILIRLLGLLSLVLWMSCPFYESRVLREKEPIGYRKMKSITETGSVIMESRAIPVAVYQQTGEWEKAGV